MKTWLHMRQAQPVCDRSRGVWFSQSTPKYSFMVWVAIWNRLQICDTVVECCNEYTLCAMPRTSGDLSASIFLDVGTLVKYGKN